jgi:serine/threonine protein phosphatase 1
VLGLIRKLRRREQPEPFTAPVQPGGRLVYAVGDIHGRHDLLERLLEKVLADAAASGDAAGVARPCIVFLGDYIDRGEGARQTVALLRGFAGRDEAEPVFLMGNHEEMLLRFIRDPSTGARWLRNGGLQTLLSYGVRGVTSLSDPDDATRLRDELVSALGPDLAFIEGLVACHRVGNVFFAHAGADPGVPTDEQERGTLLWGTERFQGAVRSDGVWVVYGHFVVDQPFAAEGRIAVDTGAYYSGRLTAARISDGDIRFLQS